MAIHTPVCDVLDIVHPVVQAGMAERFTNAELVAAVSEAGGLGILGCLGRSANDALEQIRRIRTLTDRPFGVNFVLHVMDEDTFRACLAEHVAVFSFFRGDPAEAVERAHEVGAVTIHQITTVMEAERAWQVGVDVLVAQGCEAGGHMGPLPLLSLLPEVCATAGSRPVLAAGGIVDGHGLAGALCLGAAGVLMGTRFLATPECPTPWVHKQAILDAALDDTVASGIWDILWGEVWPGVKVRSIRNQMTEQWVGREDQLRAIVEEVRAAFERANEAQDPSLMALLAGQGAARIHDLKPAGQIVRDVVAEAEQILHMLGAQIH
jgi:nitronate monooxygenase/enoyl-[acyl-carrier protein] reductase II